MNKTKRSEEQIDYIVTAYATVDNAEILRLELEKLVILAQLEELQKKGI